LKSTKTRRREGSKLRAQSGLRARRSINVAPGCLSHHNTAICMYVCQAFEFQRPHLEIIWAASAGLCCLGSNALEGAWRRRRPKAVGVGLFQVERLNSTATPRPGVKRGRRKMCMVEYSGTVQTKSSLHLTPSTLLMGCTPRG
jgi:hypothetical protein